MEWFGCCALHMECTSVNHCVAELNKFLTPQEIKEYPKYCALAARLRRGSVKEESVPPVDLPAEPMGQLSLF